MTPPAPVSPLRVKGLEFGTNEAFILQIKTWTEGVSKILTFCLYDNMAASNTGILRDEGKSSRKPATCIRKPEGTRE